jgi:hypothetical protein
MAGAAEDSLIHTDKEKKKSEKNHRWEEVNVLHLNVSFPI